MTKHLFLTVVLAGVVGLSVLAAGQSQLDIALEGPWILFTGTMNANGSPIAVLVAVAPISATVPDPVDPHSHFHHSPQISSGNGFYLPSFGIFCLAFGRCAPLAGSTFNNGQGYAPEPILTFKGNSTNAKWLSYGGNNDVVILPMPDFYHSDGTWPMRFHSDDTLNVSVDPVNYTVGLILHYSDATARLRLYSCTPNTQTAISVTDCPNEAQDGQNHLIEVTNTGTLRLQMRAPDTTDDCDHHVRYAFHQMLKLLDPNYTDYPKYRYIEPAQGMNINDSGVFETPGDDCFTNDAGDQDDPSPPATPPSVVAMQENSAKQSNPFSGTLNKINTQDWPSSEDPRLKNNERFKAARNTFDKALKLNGSLLITDVRRMGHLTALSADQIGSLIAELQTGRSKKQITKDESDTIDKLVTLKRDLNAFADGTKNGADCRAAQVLVQ
jgi:hypothetical protein